MPSANEIAIYTSLANRTPSGIERPSQAARITTNSFKGFAKYSTKQDRVQEVVRASRVSHHTAVHAQAPEIPHNIDDFAVGSVRWTCEDGWEYYVAKASTRRHRAIAERIETCRRLLQSQASAPSH